MTNYNDGERHRWDGGDCPVHPETVVIAITAKNWVPCRSRAKFRNWREVIAFRVLKEYRKPIELWVAPSPYDRSGMRIVSPTYPDAIKVREVRDA